LLYSDRVGSYAQTGEVPGGPPTWTLTAGWNLLGPSLGSPSPTSASAVLQAVLQQSGGSMAAIYKLANGAWSTPVILHRGGSPTGTDFTLTPGAGYLLYTDTATSLSFAAAAQARGAAVHPGSETTGGGTAAPPGTSFPPVPSAP
jgi:hypothetical protein